VLALSVAAKAENAAEGETLYKKYCKSCHKLTDQLLVGPGFKGVTSRHSEEWLSIWIKSPKAMIESGDSAAIALKEKYKALMPTIKGMQSDEAIKNVISFLKENDTN
jgi:cytochrome c2